MGRSAVPTAALVHRGLVERFPGYGSGQSARIASQTRAALEALNFPLARVLAFSACASVTGGPPPPGPNRPYRRAYDHRIRDLVCEEREPALFAQLGIPRSTTASWIRRGCRPVVTTELFAQDEPALRARVLKLEYRVQLLLGIVRLLFVLVRLFGFRLGSQRVPSGEAKSTILGAIVRTKKRLPVTVVLRVLGNQILEFDDRKLVAFSQIQLDLHQSARQLLGAGAARLLLRERARHENATRGLPWTDAGRDLLRASRRCP